MSYSYDITINLNYYQIYKNIWDYYNIQSKLLFNIKNNKQIIQIIIKYIKNF